MNFPKNKKILIKREPLELKIIFSYECTAFLKKISPTLDLILLNQAIRLWFTINGSILGLAEIFIKKKTLLINIIFDSISISTY